jgi:hypothetical protein
MKIMKNSSKNTHAQHPRQAEEEELAAFLSGRWFIKPFYALWSCCHLLLVADVLVSPFAFFSSLLYPQTSSFQFQATQELLLHPPPSPTFLPCPKQRSILFLLFAIASSAAAILLLELPRLGWEEKMAARELWTRMKMGDERIGRTARPAGNNNENGGGGEVFFTITAACCYG